MLHVEISISTTSIHQDPNILSLSLPISTRLPTIPYDLTEHKHKINILKLAYTGTYCIL